MRTIPVGLSGAIAAESTTLCRLWRVTRSDGVVLRFTDSTSPIKVAIDPDGTPQTYRSDYSFTSSAVFSSGATFSTNGLRSGFFSASFAPFVNCVN